MRKSKLLSLWILSSDDSRVTKLECHPGTRSVIGSIMVLLFAIALVACGGDSSTSANDDESSSSSVIPDSVPGSASSSSKTDSGTSAGMTSSSTKKSSSSRMDLILSSGDSRTSSSLQNDRKSSSSSVISDKKSSSSVISDSVPGSASSSSKTDSGTSVGMTSSSEYVPFDHSKTLAEDWRVGENRYKQFTDPRNGRSYYYITIYSEYKGYSVTIMAENLNIGEMVLGKNDQNDDIKIERYCYNNDTTKCDEFGGLYQWAEMMQLPSRCNTESCSDLIQPNHQGVCPDGWRLMTYDDFAVVMGYKDEFGYGIKGLRSAYGFGGNNYSGWSLTGAGWRTVEGGVNDLKKGIYWYLPEEFEGKESSHAHSGLVSADDEYAPTRNNKATKTQGYSVRCVMVE